ncbi:trigger factor [Lachnospiraceae bacterium XBB1006]|nr:trigger factor [Lachnospiraceae bacterium XBB1006]
MSNYAKRREAEALERKQNNQKTALKALIIVAVLAILIGGGYYLKNKSSNKQNVATATGDPDYNIDDYVKLGKYEGVKVNSIKPEVTDETFENKKKSLMDAAVEYKDLKDRGVQKGDKVTIDFDGTMNGKAFDGGSGKDHEYVLGEGSMIKGFDEGLYGVKVGESKTLNLTFPKDYGKKELAGKDVVFEVTINKAQEVSYQPKWDDEFAKKSTDGEYSDIASYEKKVKEDLLSEAKQNSEDTLKNDVWEAVVANAKIDGHPDYVYNTVKQKVTANIQSTAQMYKMSTEDYLKLFAGGVSMKEYIEKFVNSQLVSEKLIKELKIEISDKEYDKLAKADLKTYGVKTVKELEESYGKDNLMNHYKAEKLYDYLVEKANVKEVTQAEYTKLKEAASKKNAKE